MTLYSKIDPKAGPDSAILSGALRGNTLANAEGGYSNWALNGAMVNWPAGDAAAPAYFRLNGAPTISRAGLGLADTTHIGPGKFSAKLVSSGAASLEQRIIKAASFDTVLDYFRRPEIRTNAVSIGCYLRSPNASAVRLSIFDGVDETDGAFNGITTDWEWHVLTHDFNLLATEWGVRAKVNASSTMFVQGLTVWTGPIAPERPQLPIVDEKTMAWTFSGTVGVGDDALGQAPTVARPGIVTGAFLRVLTAPTGADIEVQFAKNGTADIFAAATRPKIVATNTTGFQEVNGTTYADRCLAQNDAVHMDVDVVGSTEPGQNLNAALRFLVELRPAESLLDFQEID